MDVATFRQLCTVELSVDHVITFTRWLMKNAAVCDTANRLAVSWQRDIAVTSSASLIRPPNQQNTLCRWSKQAYNKSKMADGRDLQKSKTAIYPRCLDHMHKIWHDDAFWPSEGYGQLKFPTFKNPRWRTAVILKNKNRWNVFPSLNCLFLQFIAKHIYHRNITNAFASFQCHRTRRKSEESNTAIDFSIALSLTSSTALDHGRPRLSRVDDVRTS